ncbi:MAG: peptidyl-prolyl cis-trans isomerase [Gemmatimonadales bacterium]
MMRTMRGIAPWIMGIVAVSFVGWMVFEWGMDATGQRSSGVSDEVARVNGHKIDYPTLSAAVRNVSEQQRLAGAPTPTTLEEQRTLEDEVLEQLIQQILLEGEYKRRGITVTDNEIRQLMLNAPFPEIRNIPEFQTEGEFDLAKYRRYLGSGADPNFALALEARYREELPRIKLMEQLTEDVYVSDAKLWQLFRDQHDSATATVVAILPQMVVGSAQPDVSDEALKRYHREHRDEFERPEQAYLSLVAISRRALASDSAAVLERSQSIRQEILDGTDFEAVAARESADSSNRAVGGDLGEVLWGAFVPPFEQAVRNLRPGELSEPVLTRFGYHLIQLESKSDSGFHARHILIAIELYGEHLEEVDRRADSLDVLAAAQDDPTVLDSVAARMNLVLIQAPPVYKGNRLELSQGRYLLGDPAIWAFEAAVGQTSEVIETEWAYYLFRLDSVIPAGVPPLEEIRQEVAAAAQREAMWDTARSIADSVLSTVARGASLEDAIQGYRFTPQTVGPFTRVTPSPVLRESPEAVGAAFGLPLGELGGAFETDYAVLLVQAVSRQGADTVAFAAQVDQLRAEAVQLARQTRAQLVFTSLRQDADVVDSRTEMRRQQQQGPQLPFPTGGLGF